MMTLTWILAMAVQAAVGDTAPFPPQATAPNLAPFSGAHAFLYLGMVALLVGFVLIGGFFIIRWGMLSKRDQPADLRGAQTPGDEINSWIPTPPRVIAKPDSLRQPPDQAA